MSKTSRVLALQVIVLGSFCAGMIWIVNHFSVLDMIVNAQRKIGAMETWGLILYPLLYAACNILLLPGGILAIGSGLFFGLWWGFFLVLLGNAAGAAVAFLIIRKLGRRRLEKRLFHHPKWIALDKAIERNGWKIILLSQMHPLFPTSFLNYVYGITCIRFWPCMLWITLGQAPGLFVYAYLGTLAQLGIKLLRGQTHPRTFEYVIWIGGLVLTVILTVALGRLAMKLLKEIEQAGKNENLGLVPESMDLTGIPPQTRHDRITELL